ncbi:MAG: hypothetical protein U5L04_03820 [Trueperaceae bacterium]|nr:hypothetical protein [Trueperaceae bacterium]
MNEVRAAWRLGAATCVAAFLTSALFVAPLLASQTDFGHVHPDGVTPHLHDLTAVLVSGPVPSVVVGLALLCSAAPLASAAPSQTVSPAWPRCFTSRAPPA